MFLCWRAKKLGMGGGEEENIGGRGMDEERKEEMKGGRGEKGGKKG